MSTSAGDMWNLHELGEALKQRPSSDCLFCEREKDIATTLSCGHKACRRCMSQYIEEKRQHCSFCHADFSIPNIEILEHAQRSVEVKHPPNIVRKYEAEFHISTTSLDDVGHFLTILRDLQSSNAYDNGERGMEATFDFSFEHAGQIYTSQNFEH